MAVVFKGGTSGNREDHRAPTPAGASQPVLMTETHGPVPSEVHFQAQSYERSHASFATPDFMPTGGTIPGGTDIEDPGATASSKGVPNLGGKA